MPASTTYTPLATVSGFSGSPAQLVMSNIPQTYTDLVIVGSFRTTTAAVTTSYSIILNNDFNSSYSNTNLIGTGSTATSSRNSNISYGATLEYAGAGANATASVFGSSLTHIMNYSNTTTYPTTLCKSANTNAQIEYTTNVYRSLAAISTLTMLSGTGSNIAVGSTFTLYGIKAA